MSNLKDRKVKVVKITPEMADRWLKKNTHNRPVREGVVEAYALAMKRGEWQLTSEGIAFSKPFTDPVTLKTYPETLIDGQHRLMAVIRSGKEIEFTVWYNCEPEEFNVIGQSCPRTASDILSYTRTDLKNPQAAGSVMSSFVRFGLGQPINLHAWVATTILEHVEKEVVATVSHKSRLAKMAPRPVTAALMLGEIVNPGQVGILVKQLKDAIGFTERDPARALHQYMVQQLTASTRDTPDTQFYKVCNAVAAKLKGAQMQQMRLNTDGLIWLREAGHERLEPICRGIFGKIPQAFYEPTIIRLKVEAEEPVKV